MGRAHFRDSWQQGYDLCILLNAIIEGMACRQEIALSQPALGEALDIMENTYKLHVNSNYIILLTV